MLRYINKLSNKIISINSITNSNVIKRQVHAVWSVLLSHEWIYSDINNNDEPYCISDEPYIDRKNGTSTILMIHDSHQNRQAHRKLAFALLSSSSSSRSVSKEHGSYQCLLVDVRGHGDSDIDDYESPHTINACTDDILDLITSVCHDSIQPTVVIGNKIIVVSIIINSIIIIIIGNGLLGSSVCLSYVDHILNKKATKNAHSEITGSGSIRKPGTVILIDKNLKVSEYEKDNSINDCDDDTATSLKTQSLDYINKYSNTNNNNDIGIYTYNNNKLIRTTDKKITFKDNGNGNDDEILSLAKSIINILA